MDPWVVTVAAAATLAVAAGVGYALLTRQPLLARITARRHQLVSCVERWFAVQPCFRDLVLGTYGRGFYILDDITPLRVFSEKIQQPTAKAGKNDPMTNAEMPQL